MPSVDAPDPSHTIAYATGIQEEKVEAELTKAKSGEEATENQEEDRDGGVGAWCTVLGR